MLLNVSEMCIIFFSAVLISTSHLGCRNHPIRNKMIWRPRHFTSSWEMIRITRIVKASSLRTDSWNFVNSIVTLFAHYFHPTRVDKKALKFICNSIRGTSETQKPSVDKLSVWQGWLSLFVQPRLSPWQDSSCPEILCVSVQPCSCLKCVFIASLTPTQ